MTLLIFIGILLLNLAQGQELVATFSSNNIVGTVTFFADDYSSATRIQFNLNGKLRKFTNFAAQINENIVTYENRCADIGNVLYNFQRKISPDLNFATTDLSVSGGESIVGRTLALYDLDTKQITCASILPIGQSVYARVGISNSKIAGSFEFLQGESGETVIVGEISKSDGSTTKSFGHDWIITDEENCVMHPTIFNPFNKYSRFCSQRYQERCPVGDLASKHGFINVGIAGNEGLQVVDINLPVRSIISKTLIIKSNTYPNRVLGCGKIVLAGPLNVQAVFRKKTNEGIFGNLKFKQQSPYHPTDFKANLKGLNKRTNGFHVHQYPISDSTNKCSAASVGGHLNPFNIDIKTSPKPGEGSLDLYEIGDLSGKFGFLKGQSSLKGAWIDLNLPLYGPNTIIGRSIVIHRDDATGSRLTCTDLQPVGAEKLTGKIDFTSNQNSVLDGAVIMRQFRQQNDVLTPTIIVADLKYKNDKSRQTKNHNWHVHISPLGDDKGKLCSSALGHYNPTMVNVSNPVYKKQCSGKFPYRCEIGDSSSKVGTYDIGGGKRLFADVDTPLFGKFTSLGRSMVFHVENRGAARLACGDIVPSSSVDGLKASKEFSFKIRRHAKSRLPVVRSSLSKIFNVPEWRISYLRIANQSSRKISFVLLNDNRRKW